MSEGERPGEGEDDGFGVRRRALGRTLVGVGVLGLVLVGGALLSALREQPSPLGRGPVDLQLRQVLEIAHEGAARYASLDPACEPGPACPGDVPARSVVVLEDAVGSRYRLGPSVLSAAEVTDARPMQATDGSWSVVLRLTPLGGDAVARLTASAAAEAAPRDRVAIVIDGALASVAIVAAQITEDELAIVGDLDAGSAASLAARLART